MSLINLVPKQPENDIDVFLALFIEDLGLMKDEGVLVFDAHHWETF